MKKVFSVFLFLLIGSINVFSQNDQSEERPRAYFVGSSKRADEKRPRAYVVGEISQNRPSPYRVNDGNRAVTSRPRVYKAEQPKPARVSTEQSKPAKVSKKINAQDLERRAFQLINEQRAKSGMSPLKWSDDAARIARLHSENMANFDFFSHTGVDGKTVDDRADLLGISRWKAIGENIAFNQGYENPVEFAVERWMQSPKHRDNLLSSRWKESGIGIAVTENGIYYFTEVFLVRK